MKETFLAFPHRPHNNDKFNLEHLNDQTDVNRQVNADTPSGHIDSGMTQTLPRTHLDSRAGAKSHQISTRVHTFIVKQPYTFPLQSSTMDND